ncbi:MAG TPA: YkgJ family cysteine cluster protein [Geobacterales bacterium]|nr:YkgJ family cysteine cluster protein [Geobacterales bacterium]
MPSLPPSLNQDLLDSYRQLVAKVDGLCQNIHADLRDAIVCRPGCAACCQHLSLFWVEGANLALALAALPKAQQEEIRSLAREHSTGNRCPLLKDNRCLLYATRPLICRTHGYPLLINEGDQRRIDHCPENFHGLSAIPGSDIIDTERLATILVAVNGKFMAEAFATPPTEPRLTLAQFLLLPISPT